MTRSFVVTTCGRMLPALALLLALSAPLAGAAGPSKSTGGKVAIVLDGRKITLSDIEYEAARIARAEGLPKPPAKLPKELRDRTLEQIITRELLFREGEAEAAIDKASINAAVAEDLANFEKNPAELAKFLKSEQITKETLRQQLYSDYVVGAYVTSLNQQVKVNELELREAYDRNREAAIDRDTEVRLAHIIIHGPDYLCSETAEKARIQIEQIHREVSRPFSSKEDKGIHFFSIARQFSDSPTRLYGGFLGRKKKGRFAPEFDAMAWSLADNEVSKPFKIKGDWYIVWVIDRIEPEFRSYEFVKPRLVEDLLTEKRDLLYRGKIKELLSKAKLEVFLPDWRYEI